MSETEDKPELEVEAPDVEEETTQEQKDSGIDKDIEKLSVSENDNKPEEEIGNIFNVLISYLQPIYPDIDLNDPEVESAALKIQSAFSKKKANK